MVAVRDVAPPIREDESEKCIKNAVSVFALYCCLVGSFPPLLQSFFKAVLQSKSLFFSITNIKNIICQKTCTFKRNVPVFKHYLITKLILELFVKKTLK